MTPATPEYEAALKALDAMASPAPAPTPLRSVPRQRHRAIRARFDAAQWTDENRKHWQYADAFSINAAIPPAVRRTLRNRCRYETANNSYARGIILTLANDTIGTGPRLHMTADAGNDTRSKAVNDFITKEFGCWAREVGLAELLRTMRIARAQDGEAFILLTSNDRMQSPVTLDLKLLEADQIASPNLFTYNTPTHIDGIMYDERTGDPVEYHMLKYHPGDNWAMAISWADVIKVRPEEMIHYYRNERPGQRRGLPEIMPALPLFAMLRRYTLAVLAAAETAADFAAVLYTDSPANGESSECEPMDVINLERRMATVLPGGWKLGQVAAEQPTTTYREFKAEILNEIARCLNMPFNVAACNSSTYNYSSGQLDHLTYFKSIRVDQTAIEMKVLDRLFNAWFDEAVLVEGYLPEEARRIDFEPTHQWFWDGREHADPTKMANAEQIELEGNTTTLRTLYARKGLDWENELRQRAREKALERELGLTPDPTTAQPGATPPATPAKTPAPTNAPDLEDGDAAETD